MLKNGGNGMTKAEIKAIEKVGYAYKIASYIYKGEVKWMIESYGSKKYGFDTEDEAWEARFDQ